MPRAKLLYKHRKLTTHETKQYEQPLCSVQQSHSDLNPLQQQSVLQYPTATTKMASSNIQPQPGPYHAVICIMPKDSQQDFISDSGQLDLAKIKEHADSVCILPDGSRVSLEVFSLMLQDTSQVQMLQDMSQMLQDTSQVQMLQDMLQMLQDTSQVEMHTDCYNSILHCTAEESKHLQPNQENNDHGFSSSLNNPTPSYSSQRSLEDHTISSSTPDMENQPTLETDRDVVLSFVGNIAPPSGVENQELINPLDGQPKSGILTSEDPCENLFVFVSVDGQINIAEKSSIKTHKDGQPKSGILTSENPFENLFEFVSVDGQINIAEQSSIKTPKDGQPNTEFVSVDGQINIAEQSSIKTPKGPKSVQGKDAVCNHCGCNSTDFLSCQGCGKKSPDNIKSVSDDLSEVLPVSKAEEPQENSNSVIKIVLTYPPPPAKGGIAINTEDLKCLKPKTFVNDVIIDFYLMYLLLTIPPELRERIHIMGAYFYTLLTLIRPTNAYPQETDPNLSPAERRHHRVKGWTKKIDLFKKDFILIPINQSKHWFLAIICFPALVQDHVLPNTVTRVTNTSTKKSSTQSKKKATGGNKISKVQLHKVSNNRDEASGAESEMEDEKIAVFPGEPKESATDINLKNTKQPCILIFDSYPNAKRTNIVATLREYLDVEFKTKYKMEKKFTRDTMRGSTPLVPLQDNGTDCGLFTLQYAESFLKNPVGDFRLPITTLQNMFPVEAAKSKRREIQQIICKLILETKGNVDALNLPLSYPLQTDTQVLKRKDT